MSVHENAGVNEMDNFLQREFEEERKKKKKRKTILLFTLIGAAVVAGITLIVVFSYYYMNRTFSGYDVVRERTRTDSNGVAYAPFQGNLLKYGRDGIQLIDETGETLWNGGYEVENPMVKRSGEYVIVADIGAKNFYVYNGTDQGVHIETTLPIGNVKISSGGKAAVLLHDVDSDVVCIYNPYGTVEQLEAEIPTNVTDDGYPLDFDISPDGDSVVIAYMLVENGTMENKVCFYNFTETGQEQNILVGGKSFETKMISRIGFVASDKVAVFHEKGFSLFENMKKPEEIFEKDFEEEIKSADYDEDSIMIITGSAGSTENQKLCLYNFRGKEELAKEISYKYSGFTMAGNEIIFTDERNCHIIRKNGKEKFSFEFEKKQDYFLPAAKDNQYYCLDETSIQLVKISG